MGTIEKALVISGVRTGIGRDIAVQAAARGYTVVGCSSSPESAVRDDGALRALLDGGVLHYLQVDVADADQVATLARHYAQLAKGSDIVQLDVIANAGIAAWGDPGDAEQYAAMERMWAINVDGTRHLAEAMASDLRAATRGRFVAMSSIVAAEGQAIAGNTRYMASKHAVQHFATGTLVHDPRFEGVVSFAVAPGVVPTPMIMDELLLPMLLRTALAQLRTCEGFATALARFVPQGREQDAAQLDHNTPADNLRLLFSDLLDTDPKLARLGGALDGDPELTRGALAGFVRHARKDGPMRDRILAMIYALDLAVRPELVAARVLDQLATDEPPKKRLLKVYSEAGHDPILGLMRAL